MSVPIFPTVNATLNGLALVFLIAGFLAVKKKKIAVHKKMMLCAFWSSVLFLISYISYHICIHGVTRYQGKGILRPIYFFILTTHTILAVAIVPFVIAALYYGLKNQIAKHVSITRYLWPTWTYVSLTGVVVYVMLYIF